jgi:VanZ family protein
MNRNRMYGRLVTFGCAGVLAVTLTAGLAPFHAPKNDVEWLAGQNGIEFGRHGTLLSAAPFRPGISANSSGSIEIWLEPALAAKRKTILSFDGSAHPGEPFAVLQDKSGIEVRRHNIDSAGTVRTGICDVAGVFHRNQPVFLTVTLAEHQTSVYVNGVSAKTCAVAGSSANNFTGKLVIANSPIVSNSWPGKLMGLAIYGEQLSPAETAQDYSGWTRQGKPELAASHVPAAVYSLEEHGGAVAHNQLDAATDLRIPEHYVVLHPAFLSPPWREYRPRWSYWADVAVNIAGLIPWGFCLAAYFYSVRRIHNVALWIVFLGFAVSLTIEVLQSWLPTRSSGTTDLFTNMLGTALGLLLYRWSAAQRLITKIRTKYRLVDGTELSGASGSSSDNERELAGQSLGQS